VFFKSHNQSIGFQRASTTLQTRDFQTEISSILPVALAFSHSLILLNHSRTTTQTKCSSKFKATHFQPVSKETTSL